MDHKIFKCYTPRTNLVGVQVPSDILPCVSNIFPESIINVYSNSINDYPCFSPRLTVEEYLMKLSSLRLLITDRFHGSLLSMLTTRCRIPIVAYENPSKWKTSDSKLRYLFSSLGIPEFVVSNTSEMTRLLNNIK